MQSKLVIFDGNALMHRAFHALPPLTTKKGEPINAVYGLVSMLLNVVENLKPTHIIFCFVEKARIFLKSVKIPVYSKVGFEADDVIGTIATNSGVDEVVIVTGDRDILQIVDDTKNIKLFMPIAGLSNGKIFTKKETIERMGVTPSQIPDYKALVGDPSDNYFGISGIGPKTAINLLDKYGTLGGVYLRLNDLPKVLKDKLENGKDSAELSYKLATIDKKVPIKYDIKNADKWDLISKNVLQLFSDFGFKTLTLRIRKLGEQIEQEKQGSLF